ncbi:MAG: regulatory iron-sulfur-containing complex subunit RicT [Candidatus Falkowbacteria bacterium]
MKIVQVQFAPWDKKYNFSPAGLDLSVGDDVIVDTEFGLEFGKVAGFSEVSSEEAETIKPVVRKAAVADYEKISNANRKEEVMDYCHQLILNYELPMKLVDVHFSLSGNKINFAFASDGRVDFRQLVKDLTVHFNSGIRLTQIGSRDEARISGDCGHCGRELCCKKFIKDFSSISSEMAEAQQVVHRGSDRISGQCGRLMCCLQYEYEGYQDLAKKLPPLGARVNVDGRRGEVLSHHVLKQSVSVKFPGDRGEGYTIVEVDLNRHNKPKKE